MHWLFQSINNRVKVQIILCHFFTLLGTSRLFSSANSLMACVWRWKPLLNKERRVTASVYLYLYPSLIYLGFFRNDLDCIYLMIFKLSRMMEEHSDGGAGPSSFCSRAEGQSFAETDAVFTEADTAATPIMDHRFIESPHQDQPHRDVSNCICKSCVDDGTRIFLYLVLLHNAWTQLYSTHWDKR